MKLQERMKELSGELAKVTGHEIRVHTGINTGPLVMQRLEGGEFQIAGALRVAERLAGQAEAEEILVTPDTRRLIAALFETESREPLRLKGRSEPIMTYRVLGESGYQTRLDAAERVGLTAYTGRERELGVLRECVAKALSGQGQFATVVGETGLGKSRLLLEFRQGLAGEVKLLQGRCRPPEIHRPLFTLHRSSAGLPGTAGGGGDRDLARERAPWHPGD